jgi:S1-C subfamily serine protease
MIKRSVKVLITLGILSTVALKAPQWHGDYIRNKVGSQVVMLTNEEQTSGGTGFAIQTPSGDVLTLTNAHVCGLANAQGVVYAKTADRRPIPLRVLEKYNKADLCLLDKVPGMTGVNFAGKR